MTSSGDSALLVFGTGGDIMAFVDIPAGEGWMESYDVLAGEYAAIYTLDGRIVHASGTPRGGPVTLSLTGATDAEGLRQRLERAKAKGQIRSDVDDRVAVANELLRHYWEGLWPRRPRWLARRLHGAMPLQITSS